MPLSTHGDSCDGWYDLLTAGEDQSESSPCRAFNLEMSDAGFLMVLPNPPAGRRFNLGDASSDSIVGTIAMAMSLSGRPKFDGWRNRAQFCREIIGQLEGRWQSVRLTGAGSIDSAASSASVGWCWDAGARLTCTFSSRARKNDDRRSRMNHVPVLMPFKPIRRFNLGNVMILIAALVADDQLSIPGDRQNPPRRRFRVRISLRALMVLVLVIAIGLGWHIHQAREQRLAVQAILARGGIVEYDYRYDAARDRRLPNGKSWCPVWLQNAIGDDNFFHNVGVAGLDFDTSGRSVRPTDADLVHLERLRHLKLLYLHGGSITDNGIEHLKNMTDLRMLVLSGNPISGAGLKHLRDLGNMRHLDLNNTAVTDDQLICLKDLTGLERIDLANNPRLTGAFLQHVADLPKLTSLVLRGSGITDSGLVHLKRAKNLQSLMLDGTKVTDAGLPYLRPLANLQSLDLSQTAVTDAGLPHLRGLVSLRSLDLSRTAVTDGGIARIRAWSPQASVKSPVPDQ